MGTPCDICIEEDCGGTHDCHCETCERRDECPKFLKPIIRVTTRCTQACSHCCFSCSPTRDDHMTVAVARDTAQFMKANEILAASIMGGEVFCNPDWREILPILLADLAYCRIVTNGDWVGTDFLDVLAPFKRILNLSISKDRWHDNKNVEAAAAACDAGGFRYGVTSEAMDTTDMIVPVGRGDLYSGFYSMMGAYCQNPVKKYSFMVDETGEIYKCGFGVWAYASVSEYLDGDFAPRFKSFNRTFYGCFVSSCASCVRSYSLREAS